MKRAIPALLPLLLLAGCLGPSLAGKWHVTSADLPVPAEITATFTNPDQVLVDVQASPEFFGKSFKLQAAVTGSYKLEGENLTGTTKGVDVKSNDNSVDLNGPLGDNITSEIKQDVAKNLNGKVKWDGNDKFTLTLADGKVVNFERMKG
ncbi:MAG: hypothetical protein JSS66_11860 [Armatimonadetes bacterium]|nr:hypothetical protein [Armatimonadota bacterium]